MKTTKKILLSLAACCVLFGLVGCADPANMTDGEKIAAIVGTDNYGTTFVSSVENDVWYLLTTPEYLEKDFVIGSGTYVLNNSNIPIAAIKQSKKDNRTVVYTTIYLASAYCDITYFAEECLGTEFYWTKLTNKKTKLLKRYYTNFYEEIVNFDYSVELADPLSEE